MAISKVILDGTTIMDVTRDTVDESNLLSGKTATKANGVRTTGEYLPTSIIDDTAGIGDTDKVWSADKTYDELADKADKVASATNGHFAALNLSGNLTDSGYNASSFVHEPASEGQYGQVLTTDGVGGRRWTTVQGGGSGTTNYNDLQNKPQIEGVTLAGNKSLSDLGIAAATDIPDISGKADKVASATNGNFAGLDANGNLIDSGKKASDFTNENYVRNTINSNMKLNFRKEFGYIAPTYDGTKVYHEGDLCTYYDVDNVYPSNTFVPTLIYKHKSWGAIPPEEQENFTRAFWDIATIEDCLAAKISEPPSDGTSGQVLTTDGQGGRSWTTVQVSGGGNANVSIDTTSGWNSRPNYIPQRNEFIVYSDHYVVDNVAYSSVKIGDGLAYVVDLPFIDGIFMPVLEEHLNNTDIHVSAEQKIFWDNKLNYNIVQENLILNRG